MCALARGGGHIHAARAWVGKTGVDLRGLRYFMEVARTGSISAAARALNVAQPALSRQLQKLEDELGLAVFQRHGRGVRLTPEGAILLERAEAVMASVHDIPAQLRGDTTTLTGHAVLGLPPAAGLLLAPLVVERYRRAAPRASLQIREGISSSLEEWLLDTRVDVAVLHNPAPLPALDIVPLLRERMVVATAPGAREGHAPVRLRELGELPLILPGLPHSNRRLLDQAALQHGARLNPALEVDSVALTKAMVRRGRGCTILTFAAVQDEVARGELLARPIERPPLLSIVSVATRRDHRGSPLPALLVGMLREIVRELVTSGAWQGAQLIRQHRVEPAA